MNLTVWEYIKPYIAVFVRYCLILIVGYLLTKKIPLLNVLADLIKNHSVGLEGEISGFIIGFVTLCWGWWKARHSQVKTATALTVSTDRQLKEKMKTDPVKPTIAGLILLLFLIGAPSGFAQGQTTPPPLRVSEIDGAPNARPVNYIKFPNGSIAAIGSTITVTFPSAPTQGNLTVGAGLSVTGGSGAVFGSGTSISLGAVVVTSVVNDTNVTGVIASNALTLGWTGRLSKARQESNTAYIDQNNTFGAFVQTFQAGSNFVLTDTSDVTKKSIFDLSNIAGSTTRTVNIPNANSTTLQPSTAVSNQFMTGVSSQGVISRAQPAFSDISGSATIGQLPANVVNAVTNDTNITGSVSTNTLTLGFTGTLAKSRQNSNTAYIDQSNTFGAFVQTFQAGANFLLTDPTTPSKHVQFDLSNISASTTRTVNLPDANSTTVQASSAVSNQFLTAISAQGVISRAQPAFTDFSGTISAAQIPASISLTTPTIASLTNAQHNHQNAAGGGSLDAAAIGSGIVSSTRGGAGTVNGILKANGSGSVSSASLGSDYINQSSTDTLTNKTLDVEATGNSITTVSKVFLPAAGCAGTVAASFWDLPTSTPAVAACVTGTNVQKGVLDYADTSGGFSAQNTLLLPADFSGNIDAKIIWTTTATSGNAKWSLSTACTAIAATATDDPSFNTASTVTTAAAGTTNRVNNSAITSLTITGCAANTLLHLRLFRDGNDGSDTISATARLIGLELTIRRAQ